MPLTAAGVTAAATLGSVLYNAGAGIYNAYYQRKLQNKIFDREDNAVTRRYKDLIAAGINPNLAAGSAAGAGSVVGSGRPLDTGINAGQIIDVATAGEQLKQQRYATQAAKDYAQMMHAQAGMAKMQNNLAFGNMLYQLGFPISNVHFGDNGMVNFTMDSQDADFKTSPFFNSMQAGVDSAMYQRNILQKENAWYTTNQVLNQVWNGFDAGIDIAGSVLGYKKLNKPQNMQGGRDFIYDSKGRMSGYRDFKFQP